MPHPLQDREIDSDLRRARAPYNFVRLPDQIAQVGLEDLPPHDRYDPGRLTGRIACRLTTSSPLYIRAGLRRKAFRSGEESRLMDDFFFWDEKDQPVIPGSSLRGLFRTAVEIVTFSKPGPIAEDRYAYRSVGGTTNHAKAYRDSLVEADKTNPMKMRPKMQAGYMHRNGREWLIIPAQDTGLGYNWARVDNRRHDIRSFHQRLIKGSNNAFKVFIKIGQKDHYPVSHRYPGEMEYVKVADMKDHPIAGYQDAVLVKGGDMNNKHYEAVVMPEDRSAKPLKIAEDLVRLYRDQIKSDHLKLVGNEGLLQEGQPVFYLPDPEDPQKVVFFGNCLMFRLPYSHPIKEYLDAQLKDDSLIDMAEAIFGYSKKKGEGKQRNYAGRLYFSSAKLVASPAWLSDQGFWMKVLSEPKPTCFQHYLVQRNADTHSLVDYNAQPMTETALRGHKQYWHKGLVSKTELEGEESNVAARARPLAAGNTFEFEIRFENLSQPELGALLWVLFIAGEKNHRLKLGMGKPYGMGAVAVNIKAIDMEKRLDRYQVLIERDSWHTPRESTSEAEKICNDCLDQFEQFVIEGIGQKGSMKTIEAHDRIQEYLRLLTWPGPDKAETPYMPLEEFKQRKVLPSPLDIRLDND